MQTSTWAVLLVTLVGLTEVAAIPSGARKPDCHLYYVPFCPRNFEPVCGSDGVTYPNECTLCAENEINPGVFIIKEAAC